MSNKKIYCYNQANRDGMNAILRRKQSWWIEELQRKNNETDKELIERIWSSFESFFLVEVVNANIPYHFKGVSKRPPASASFEEKQAYIASILIENADGTQWHQALKFISEDMSGSRTIGRIKTKTGEVLHSHQAIAEYLNIQFTQNTHKPEDMCIQPVHRPERVMVFKMSPTTIEEELEKLHKNKATGPSDISNEMLMAASSELAPYLYDIFQLCLKLGRVPIEWLRSQVTPVYKGKGDMDDEDNLRPISVSHVLAKLLEHFVANYLYEVLNENSILHPRQHGHRKGYSAESQLACFREKVSESTRDGCQVDCLKIDFKSATSYVNHDILLNKLKNLPIEEKIYTFIKRVIKNHRQYVKIGNALSTDRRMSQGLAQGSPLTNPLFLIYIDGIFDCTKTKKRAEEKHFLPRPRVRIRGNGDDLLVDMEVKTKEDQYSFQEVIYILEEYIKGLGLKVNRKKLQVITFFNRQKMNPEKYLPQKYHMFGNIIERVKSLEYLGVTISNDLTYYDHVNKLLTKFSPQFDSYMEYLKLCAPSIQKLLFISVLRPKLEMGSSIWNLKTDYSEDQLVADLERLQQKFAAYILDKDFHPESWHPSWNENLELIGWEPLSARRLMRRLALTSKFMERMPCLQELVNLQEKLIKNDRYEDMKRDPFSLLALCKKNWRSMRAYFKSNPVRDLSIDDCCMHCQELFCRYAFQAYEQNRDSWLVKLEKKGPDFAAQLAERHPYGIHSLVKF